MGTTTVADGSVGQRVVDFGTTHIGMKVGRGECWDLPAEALEFAGAKPPPQTHLYRWGTLIPNLRDAQPGDILQFERVRIKRNWTLPDGRPAWEEMKFGVHHSAIVQKVDGELWFTTLNAHINGSKNVQVLRMNLSPENIKHGNIFLYRPIPNE